MAIPEPMWPMAIVAAAWGVSPQHIHQLAKKGELIAIDISARDAKRPMWRITESAINAYVASKGRPDRRLRLLSAA